MDYYPAYKVKLATGIGNRIDSLDLSKDNGGAAFPVPHVESAYIDIRGGTMVNVYGGGDMATVTGRTTLSVNYAAEDSIMRARAGFDGTEALLRVWNTFHLTADEQIEEVTATSVADPSTPTIFKYHIYRIFGGNNQADMAIQPTWNLVSGHLGSVYSGGNFGRMTYYDASTGVPTGLTLRIDSPDFHADAVFGGGRVGDIEPAVTGTPGDAFYGATLEINRGVIDHVYGGNDVSGNVSYGSRVKITGAISGDVYCAGNGNYRYQYDPELTTGNITEAYDSIYGGRYFILPQLAGYGDDDPTDAERILAINAYRPNVQRAYLTIAGVEGQQAFVRGNVYCGGNSSTVNGDLNYENTGDIRFEIGDYVVLNGVFLGSNGESLIDPEMMGVTERLNGIVLSDGNDLKTTSTDPIDPSNKEYYPALLDLYMRAVETTGLPRDFTLSPTLKEAYIGDFYVGGNSGSMLTDRTISLTFPYNLVIFNRIVGGSNSANVTYRGVTHVGGLTTPLSTDVDPVTGERLYTDKVYLQVRSQFRPLKMLYPAEADDYRSIAMVPDLSQEGNDLYFPEGKCNVFGGCYNSGKTVGNIHVDLYSDLVKEYDAATLAEDVALLEKYFADRLQGIDLSSLDMSKQRIIVNGIDKLQRRSFALVGGGYGAATEVRGDIKLHLLPGKFHPDWTEGDDTSPSAATVFGGSQLGKVVGNTEIAVRDGMVLSNLYGASEASTLYGSTQVIVGWPHYYVCQKRGHYKLRRTDTISRAAVNGWTNSDDASKSAVLRDIWLREGEYVSVNVAEAIDTDSIDSYTGNFADYFKLVDDDTPQEYAAHNNSPYIQFHDITWDDIDIYIGNGNSRRDGRDEYFAHGNIYGGGFITSTSTVSLAGQYTVQKYRGTNLNDPLDAGYGGNSTILIWDNPENRNPRNVVGQAAGYSEYLDSESGSGSGAIVKDHITIGTGHYVAVSVYKGMDVMGKYRFVFAADGRYDDPNGSGQKGNYVHQSSHILTADDPLLQETFYEIESDGGIYGGGRKVYVEGFRSCDLAYYGYADYSPQYPKLLNTAQRLDLLSVTDCCLFLEGANDFATNSYDATNYSLTRIGELKMVSSIPSTEALQPGSRDTESGLYNILHLEPRTRNYIAFFHDVLYVAALTSSESFDQAFRGANGEFYDTGDFTTGVGDDLAHAKGTVSATDDYVELPAAFSYRAYKQNRIENYYANRDLDTDTHQDIKQLTSLEFDQRNIGTAANMIGINNGYTLKIQGAVIDEANQDQIYYGPVTGVFEIKLMTLATDEGGGYIYALNMHEDPNHFLETTGNFVFPGAAYKTTGDDKGKYNYVYDDCFPMGSGWDSYYKWSGSSTSMGPRKVTAVDAGHGDCNTLEEVHYWYVNGTNYYYNVTLTAYTYNGSQSFTLNNYDDLIYLYGVTNGTKLTLKGMTWEPQTDGYDSDIQHYASTNGAYDRDYRLYLTVDGTPSDAHASSANGYAVMLHRGDYDADTDTYADAVARAASVDNNYTNTTESPNKPLLGISLFDYVDNSGSAYYAAHLSQDEKVRIQLNAQPEGTEFNYTVNLTIRYLLGPSVTGNPVIENDALPGEYIYANDFGVTVELDDENMAVTERNWYILDPRYDVTDNTVVRNVIKALSTPGGATAVAECVNADKFSGDCQVHIPAYLYRDGWNLVYEVVANNIPLYITPATPPEGSTLRERLQVHNYHRMRPTDGNTDVLVDLQPTAGARIYIEDDKDLEYFLRTWLPDSCSRDYSRVRHAPGGEAVCPQYADSVYVFLMADVKMPAGMTKAEVEGLRFRGTFHGRGHSIDMGDNLLFLGYNEGCFYSTGFISRTDKDAAVFSWNGTTERRGKIESCFFYNTEAISRGVLVANRGMGDIYNCFTTSDADSREYADGLVVATRDEFEYGEVAYNLNHFYLKKRYNLATGTADGDLVAPINDDYRDGSYRYARVYSADVNPWSLRTAAIPNYADFRGIRINLTPDTYAAAGVTGSDATMHDVADARDELRGKDDEGNWLTDADGKQYYLPIYPTDYLFFGQDLAYASPEDQWPHAIDETKRVYRASGFYGSRVDQGFHFNVDAAAVQPSLTAIDFSGVRDGQYTGTSGDFIKGYSVGMDVRADRSIWYAPALDLPDVNDPDLGLTSFTTATIEGETEYGKAVTRNLLIYTPVDMPLLASWKYDTDAVGDDIYGHVIDNDGGGIATDYFQLVDCEDFNCPIQFDVNRTIWYRRLPSVFATGQDAWEGLCLPFTVHTVYGSVETRERGSLLNHGEMSHFYGPAVGKEVKADSHEYWLRKFTGVEGLNAYFARPASGDDTDALNPQETTRDYAYSNLYFLNLYGSSYTDGTTHADQAPAYTATGVNYENYPMITARYPYIVSYPGERFYEFDCSGEFYKAWSGSPDAVRQIMTYAWNVDDAGSVQPIKVTDLQNDPLAMTHSGFIYRGTFMHYTATASDVVIDTDASTNSSTFVRAATVSERTVLPFRTYLTNTSGAWGKTLRITSRSIDSIGEDGGDGDDDDGDEPEDSLRFYVEFNELVIDNPYDVEFTLPLYDLEGRLVRHVTAGASGLTRVRGLSSGAYLLRSFKFRIQ